MTPLKDALMDALVLIQQTVQVRVSQPQPIFISGCGARGCYSHCAYSCYNDCSGSCGAECSDSCSSYCASCCLSSCENSCWSPYV